METFLRIIFYLFIYLFFSKARQPLIGQELPSSLRDYTQTHRTQ